MLWDGALHDLNDLVLPGTQAVLRQAYAINDVGQIVVNGTGADGHEHAFLLTPIADVPEPSSVFLLCIGLAILGFLRPQVVS